MTRQTQLRNLRKNLPEVLNPQFHAVVPRTAFSCPVCGYPMLVSIGQEVTAHKKCKKRFKEHNRRFKNNGSATPQTTEKEA